MCRPAGAVGGGIQSGGLRRPAIVGCPFGTESGRQEDRNISEVCKYAGMQNDKILNQKQNEKVRSSEFVEDLKFQISERTTTMLLQNQNARD